MKIFLSLCLVLSSISGLSLAATAPVAKEPVAKEPVAKEPVAKTPKATTITPITPTQTIGEKNLKEAETFLADNKKKDGVITLPSGLQYKIVKEGTGQSPNISDFVTVHYRGAFIDGKVFDQTSGNQPATFPVNAVIPAWTEALQLMKPGAKWVVYAPPKLAYGEKGAGKVIGPNAVLIFDVELLAVKKPPSDNEDPNSIYDEEAGD